MSTSQDIPDQDNPLDKKVKDLKQNNNSKEVWIPIQALYSFKNNKIALIYHDEFFLNVYKKVFEKYGLEVTLFKEIDTESIADISKINPLVIVVIDDYLGKQVDYSSQISAKLKNSNATKNMPIILTSDRPPSEIAEDIVRIYSLSQNQK